MVVGWEWDKERDSHNWYRQCSSFTKRLYNFTGKGDEDDMDSTLDSEYIARLRMKCKEKGPNVLAEMDPVSFKTSDEHYDIVA